MQIVIDIPDEVYQDIQEMLLKPEENKQINIKDII